MSNIIELILNEEDILSGVEAISIVESPAIEQDFITLSKEKLELAEVDAEKRILMGAALVPNKMIYRRRDEEEYYVYFSKDTIRKVSELFLTKGNQNKTTLEHEIQLQGLSVVESWIVEDETHDKTKKYGMNLPVGSWVVSMKVYNDQVWQEFVKTGRVKGFSIEGYFADKVNMANITAEQVDLEDLIKDLEEAESSEMLSQIRAIIKKDLRTKSGKKTELESFSDYPDAVRNNAKRGIELNEKVNNRCATQVGKIRAQQLASGKPISLETVKRMVSYLSRAEEYYDEGNTEACGTISYLLWGGKAALRWAEAKIKEIEG
jgi:hypothetical protein